MAFEPIEARWEKKAVTITVGPGEEIPVFLEKLRSQDKVSFEIASSSGSCKTVLEMAELVQPVRLVAQDDGDCLIQEADSPELSLLLTFEPVAKDDHDESPEIDPELQRQLEALGYVG